jgi:hypothetical protein
VTLYSRLGFGDPRDRCCNGLRHHRREKAVSVARKRFDVERAVGIIAKRRPDLLNAFIHALFKINEGLLPPELLLNFIPGHDLARVAREQNQKFERQGRQLEQSSGFTQFFGVEIQLEDAVAEH